MDEDFPVVVPPGSPKFGRNPLVVDLQVAPDAAGRAGGFRDFHIDPSSPLIAATAAVAIYNQGQPRRTVPLTGKLPALNSNSPETPRNSSRRRPGPTIRFTDWP